MSVILQFSQSSGEQIQIPYTMNKIICRQTRSFGRNIKNNLTQNQIEVQLALKPRYRKKQLIITAQTSLSLHPQIQYFDDIMKYVLNNITYPEIKNNEIRINQNNPILSIQPLSSKHLSLQNMNINKKYSSLKNQQITFQKRATLIDWIIQIHKRYKLRQQTLFMAVHLIDGYSNLNYISINKYQLLGTTSLFMAAKYQQIIMPLFKDYHKLIDDQFNKQQILQMESQILKFFNFHIGEKVTQLWYLQAFANQQIIFGKPIRHTRRAFLRQKSLNKQNPQSIEQLGYKKSSDHFSKFMNFGRYILNLILFDYNILGSYRQDIIAISSLMFSSFKREFSDADSKKLLNYFISQKMRYIQCDQSHQKQMKRQIKKCVQKIQWLYQKRFQNKFYNVNQKFEVDISH